MHCDAEEPRTLQRVERGRGTIHAENVELIGSDETPGPTRWEHGSPSWEQPGEQFLNVALDVQEVRGCIPQRGSKRSHGPVG
jgi:hypothetical protein